MNETTCSFSVLKASLIVAAAALVPSVAVAMMSTPGGFQVSESGAAVYTIPIKVPPGTAGMEPKLALIYNSQGGNDLLGVGWSLSGLSAITRCSRTIVQDGLNVGIQYNSNDRFCLDGQRLVLEPPGGIYGVVGAQYRTEGESFSKITSFGGTEGNPDWFEVKTKSGQTLQFGNTTDSRIEAQGKTSIRVWALNRIQDTKGNYVTVTYGNTLAAGGTLTNDENNPNGDFYSARIDYTGNAAAAVTPHASVRFTYEARTDNQPIYVGGSLIKEMNRLTSIRTYMAETLVRDYRVAYTYSSGDQASLLTSVTECAADGSCLPATTFGWEVATGTAGLTTPLNWGASGTSGPLIPPAPQIGDINGDGLGDLITISGSNLFYQLRFSQVGKNSVARRSLLIQTC